MTNGEKIQKDFQGCEVCEPIVEDDIIHVIFADKKDSAIGFDWSWWNAEYIEPSSSENPNKSEIPTSSVKIKVGDEVTVKGDNGIVVREPYPIGLDKELFVLVWYGQYMSSNLLKNVAPTGRHFPQITEVLEKLKRSCC